MNYDQIFQKIDNARHNIIKRVEEIAETYESPIDCPEDLEIVVEEFICQEHNSFYQC